MKKYQLCVSENNMPPEAIAVFDSQREARKYLSITAAKMGHRRLHRDMWSNGISIMFIEPLYMEEQT